MLALTPQETVSDELDAGPRKGPGAERLCAVTRAVKPVDELIRFVADRPGTYPYYCTEFCSALHLEMMGYLHVKPAASPTAAAK